MRKILLIEGLFSYTVLKYMRRGLGPIFDELGLQYEVWGWLGFNHSTDADVVIGHSFGGGRALRVAQQNKNIKKVITLDPRITYAPFKKPEHLAKEDCLNIFQEGFMRGYLVDGATNRRVVGISHGELPFDQYIRGQIREHLNLKNR